MLSSLQGDAATAMSKPLWGRSLPVAAHLNPVLLLRGFLSWRPSIDHQTFFDEQSHADFTDRRMQDKKIKQGEAPIVHVVYKTVSCGFTACKLASVNRLSDHMKLAIGEGLPFRVGIVRE